MRSIVYHHYGVLTHAKSVMICKKERNKSLFLMICTQTSCVMIYHYSVMDKKSRIKIIRLFWWAGVETLACAVGRSQTWGKLPYNGGQNAQVCSCEPPKKVSSSHTPLSTTRKKHPQNGVFHRDFEK